MVRSIAGTARYPADVCLWTWTLASPGVDPVRPGGISRLLPQKNHKGGLPPMKDKRTLHLMPCSWPCCCLRGAVRAAGPAPSGRALGYLLPGGRPAYLRRALCGARGQPARRFPRRTQATDLFRGHTVRLDSLGRCGTAYACVGPDTDAHARSGRASARSSPPAGRR